MLIEKLTDQLICSCGNWVDKLFYWCPDCCEEKVELIYGDMDQRESSPRILN